MLQSVITCNYMHYKYITCCNLQDTRTVNELLVAVVEPPSAVQANVPASSGVRLLVDTFCITLLNGKHVVHPPVFHVNTVEGVAGGTVSHVRVTLLNIG